MKKITALAIILALALTCAIGFAETIDVTGTWYLNEMIMNGVTFDPYVFAMEITMTINADGTASILSAYEYVDEPESTEGTWVIDDNTITITDSDSPMDFVYADGVLTAETGSETMIFARERNAVEPFVPAEVVAEPAITDFDGDWKVYMIDSIDMHLSAALAVELMGSSMISVSINNGAGVITGLDNDANEISYEATGELVGSELSFKIIDEYDNETVMTFVLYADGLISWTSGDDEFATTMYYQKVATEE